MRQHFLSINALLPKNATPLHQQLHQYTPNQCQTSHICRGVGLLVTEENPTEIWHLQKKGGGIYKQKKLSSWKDVVILPTLSISHSLPWNFTLPENLPLGCCCKNKESNLITDAKMRRHFRSKNMLLLKNATPLHQQLHQYTPYRCHTSQVHKGHLLVDTEKNQRAIWQQQQKWAGFANKKTT